MPLDLITRNQITNRRKPQQYLVQDIMDKLQETKEATIPGLKGVITCFIQNSDLQIKAN